MTTTELNKIKLEKTGKEVRIREWITAGERQYINSAFTEGMKVDTTGKAQIDDFSRLNVESDKRRFEVYITFFDGRDDWEKEELYEAIMKLPEPDFVIIDEDIKKKSPILEKEEKVG